MLRLIRKLRSGIRIEMIYQNRIIGHQVIRQIKRKWSLVTSGIYARMATISDIPGRYADLVDWDNDTILICEARAQATHDEHYHRRFQRLICVSGSFQEMRSQRIVSAGQVIDFAPKQLHKIRFIDDTRLIICMTPKIY